VGGPANVPPADPGDVRVGAGTDSPPVVRAPVAEIVPTARIVTPRPIADLIPAQAGPAEPLVGGDEAARLSVVVGSAPGAAADRRRQPRARLDGQGVGREGVGRHRQRGLEAAFPVLVGLAGRAVDEVERYVLEARLARFGGRR